MLRVLEYGVDRAAAFRPVALAAVEPLVAAAVTAPLIWIDVPAPTAAVIDVLAAALGWHPLITEDLRTRGQRQKVEQFPGTVYGVLHRPVVTGGPVEFDELDVVQSERVIVTLHVGQVELLDRLSSTFAHRPDILQNGAMSATVVILAGIADAYEDAIDALEQDVEEQEAGALDTAAADPVPALRRAAETRTAVARLRRATGQLREVVSVYVRRELVDVQHSAELDLELRDVQDHAVRAHDELDMLHDRMSALADTRLAMVAYRQNEITKRLSAWAAILITPAIVTGWFGQNFTHMVGLDWRYGELYALGVVVALCGGMWTVLRRARWI
jgi:magnesium transporter